MIDIASGEVEYRQQATQPKRSAPRQKRSKNKAHQG